MSDKSFDPKIYPLNIVGFVIMVADLIALGYWSLAIWKPRAIALIAAGEWTWWDEVMEKLILIGFWVIAYMGEELRSWILPLPHATDGLSS